MLILPLILALAASLVWPSLLWVAAGLAGAFLISTLPFLTWIARNDGSVLAPALPILAGRALAQALGLGVGVVAIWRRKPIRRAAISSTSQLIKRALDLTLAASSLVLALPLIAILGVLIKLETPGPVIFRQARIGQNGRPFQIYKLRSMVADAEARLVDVLPQSGLPGPAFKIHNDPRVTRMGRFMRRWSLDELPQLWNVLRGDMSLVGPRPEEAHVVAQYSDWHRLRLAVKPGLTGPMQVNGRGSLSLNERVRLELDYINHYSLGRDLSILLRSVPAVLSGDGAY
jgi:lipopolysaccharide/colanic/teichoic acid biosynthesis glycosyltransferase